MQRASYSQNNCADMREAIQVLERAKREAADRLKQAEYERGKAAENRAATIRHAIKELDEGLAVLCAALRIENAWQILGIKIGSTSHVQVDGNKPNRGRRASGKRAVRD